jgi:TM2 domain-containing membrane protein YozV
MKSPGAEKRTTAGIFAILLGGLGVHKFYLGYTTEGLITLAVTILTCGAGGVVMSIIGLIEGIAYLQMTDDVFVQTYINNKKGWL